MTLPPAPAAAAKAAKNSSTSAAVTDSFSKVLVVWSSAR
jgi:hypothetical protein